MPICPNCRTGYDNSAQCPKCGKAAPERVEPKPRSTPNYRCSKFGIFCLFSAWLGSGIILVLFLIKSVKDVSTFGDGMMAAVNAILHLGVCYALWITLNYATDRNQ
jgi:hypothetical protein